MNEAAVEFYAQEVPVEEITFEQGKVLVDNQAQQTLGISGEAFVRRWRAGELQATYEHPTHHVRINKLVMLLPFWPDKEVTPETLE